MEFQSEILKKSSRIRENLKILASDKKQYESFQNQLRNRLLECGWGDQIRLICAETLKERGTSLTVNELIEDVSLRARILLPTPIKKELMQQVKSYLLKHKEYSNKYKEKTDPN